MKTSATTSKGLIRFVAIGGGLVATTLYLTDAPRAKEASAPQVQAAGAHSIDLAFVTHLDMDLPEQDVYIERERGSGEVYRVTKGVGPHARGEALGMTLGQWLRHQGSGSYSCTEGVGQLETSFSGLVPNGTYTMWHAFMAMPPTTPFSGTLDLPLGARDGSTSRFEADADGKAAFVHSFKPCLEMSDVWTTSMLAINYHSDGKTYRADPGQFGLNAHIPLFLMLPNREGI